GMQSRRARRTNAAFGGSRRAPLTRPDDGSHDRGVTGARRIDTHGPTHSAPTGGRGGPVGGLRRLRGRARVPRLVGHPTGLLLIVLLLAGSGARLAAASASVRVSCPQ